METTTPFDLNRAIQQWRKNLAQSPAIRAENLDELEIHLRDSVAALQSRDLTAGESFLVATKRVGGGAALGKEFGKVNLQTIWIERVLWALVIMQIWGLIGRFASGLGLILTQIAINSPTYIYSAHNQSEMDEWFRFIAFVGVPTLILILLSLLLWKYFGSRQSWAWEKLEKLLRQPLHLAIGLLVLGLVFEIFSCLSTRWIFGVRDFPAWYYFRSLPLNLFYAGAVFVLARKQLLRKA